MPNENKLSISKRINISVIVFITLVLVLILYFIFGLKGAKKGPELMFDAPKDGVVVHSPIVSFEGSVNNVAKVLINDTPVDIIDGNKISKELILQPGENTFFVKAYDQFGNESEKTIKIIYQKQQ